MNHDYLYTAASLTAAFVLFFACSGEDTPECEYFKYS